MSKVLPRRRSNLKPTYSSNDNSYNSKPKNIVIIGGQNQNIFDNNNSMSFNNDNNNNSQINLKHFSPSSNRVKSSLPPVKGNNNSKRMVSSQKKNRIIKLMNSSSLRDIYSQKNMLSPKFMKYIGREKTQADIAQNINVFSDISNHKKDFNDLFLLSNRLEKANNNKNSSNNVKQVNNFNNVSSVNIHIYSNSINAPNNNDKNTINNITINKTDNNISLLGNNLTNDNINTDVNFESKKKKNFKNLALTPKKELINQLNEYLITENKVNPTKSKFLKDPIPNIKNQDNPLQFNQNQNNNVMKEKKIQREISTNLKTLSPLSMLSNDFTSNNNDDTIKDKFKSSTLKLVGNLVIKDNKENTSKILNKRYQSDIYENISYFDDKDINALLNIKGDSKKVISEESSLLNSSEFNEMKYFLKDFTEENQKILILFIKLIQIHLDIELLLENKTNNNFRRRVTTINNDKIFKINSLINNYFNNLNYLQKFCKSQDKEQNNKSKLNTNNNNGENMNSQNSNLSSYNIFLYPKINNIFHKCIKTQMCYYSAFMISISQLDNENIENMIKTNFNKLIKEISSPLYKIFKVFLMNELKDKYNKIILNNLRPDFFDNFNKLFLEEKIISLDKVEVIQNISKSINKCVDSLNNYSTFNLKNSIMKPFGDALNQMLKSISTKTLNRFIDIFLYTILFGELEINKQKMQKNLETNNTKKDRNKRSKKNLYSGSALFNNVKDTAPYLPEIDKKYKFTLVLDMDETLVHFFFTHMNGMFFVRPYCFDFLNELNNYYEIVTFTAGIKDYADNILNLLDINDNIIKYRLYRSHVTSAPFSSYKDLKLLGRDLKKIIIIDNLRENFRLQPDNGLFIKTWTSDVNDTQFKDLLNILKCIAVNNVDDVRPIIQRINERIKISGELINPYSKINIKKIIDDEKK